MDSKKTIQHFCYITQAQSARAQAVSQSLSAVVSLSLPADLKSEMMMIDELFVLVIVAVVVASLPQSSSSVGALVDRDATVKAWIMTILPQRL